MKKRIRIIKETTVPATVSYKGNLPDKVLKVDPSDKETIQNMKTDPNIDHATVGNMKIKEEIRKYTTEESAAVGKTVAKSLLKVLRAEGDEVVNMKLTGIGTDKFNIHVEYGNDKGSDTFKFNLNPEGTAIILALGNEPIELVDFVITQGNTVSLPTPELEDKLSDAMKKYVGEPTDNEYDQMATMEPPHDESQLNKNIAEGVDENDKDIQLIRKFIEMFEVNNSKFEGLYKQAKVQAATTGDVKFKHLLSLMDRAKAYYFQSVKNQEKFDADREGMSEVLGANSKPETYIKDFAKSKAPQFKGKSKEKKRQMAIAAYMSNKNEGLDPVGKEDDDINNDGKVDKTDKYLAKRRQAIAKNMKEDIDIGHEDNEPHMLKGDLYKLAKNTVELYKAMEALEGQGEVDFPQWWQGKIMRASDDVECAKEYLEFEMEEPAIDAAINTLGEAKGTCCHKCGHVHVKGTPHPTPYLTGKKNCKFRD